MDDTTESDESKQMLDRMPEAECLLVRGLAKAAKKEGFKVKVAAHTKKRA